MHALFSTVLDPKKSRNRETEKEYSFESFGHNSDTSSNDTEIELPKPEREQSRNKESLHEKLPFNIANKVGVYFQQTGIIMYCSLLYAFYIPRVSFYCCTWVISYFYTIILNTYQPSERTQTRSIINTIQEAINLFLDCPWIQQKLRKGPFTFKDRTVLMNFQEPYAPWN